MNESKRTTVSDRNPDEAPDLSRDGWPEKSVSEGVETALWLAERTERR